MVEAADREGGREWNSSSREQRRVQLAGIRAMGAGVLPCEGHCDECADDRGFVARGDEKLCRQAAGLQCALDREVRSANRNGAAFVEGCGGGVCARAREGVTATESETSAVMDRATENRTTWIAEIV